MIDTKFLTFLTLCETKSYTKTAEILYVTQPSVTNHIKQLEKIYNTKLFDSNTKDFNLTPSGKLLYDYAMKLKSFDLNFEHLLEALKNRKDKLTLGAPKVVYNAFLNYIMPTYVDSRSDLNLELAEYDIKELEEKLQNGLIDFAIVDKNIYKRGLICKEVFKNKIVVVCGQNSPLSIYKKINFNYVVKEQVLFNNEDIGKMDYLSKQFALKNRSLDELTNKLYVNNSDLIFNLVKANNCCYFAYESEINKNNYSKDMAIVEMNEIKDLTEFYLIYPENHLKKQLIEKIAEDLERLSHEIKKTKYISSFK